MNELAILWELFDAVNLTIQIKEKFSSKKLRFIIVSYHFPRSTVNGNMEDCGATLSDVIRNKFIFIVCKEYLCSPISLFWWHLHSSILLRSFKHLLAQSNESTLSSDPDESFDKLHSVRVERDKFMTWNDLRERTKILRRFSYRCLRLEIRGFHTYCLCNRKDTNIRRLNRQCACWSQIHVNWLIVNLQRRKVINYLHTPPFSQYFFLHSGPTLQSWPEYPSKHWQ